jgi:hypothetical protein
LSQIYRIRNVWKLPSSFSRNTLIPCSEKSSWSLYISFWKKNCPINSKPVIKKFFHVRLPYKSLNFMVFGYPKEKSPKTIESLPFEKLS